MSTDTEKESKKTNQKETLEFQTEVSQLLHLMIHSLYSNKEIFLRELISNASDACDKLRLKQCRMILYSVDDSELKIQVEFDKDERTITIRDNGIGMSREEVVNNIGTIAKSGTKEFLDQLTGDQSKDSHLIGQFGVGFYSAFIVADKVTLKTLRAGLDNNQAIQWESQGTGSYTLEEIEKAKRGTESFYILKKMKMNYLIAGVYVLLLQHIQITCLCLLKCAKKMMKERQRQSGRPLIKLLLYGRDPSLKSPMMNIKSFISMLIMILQIHCYGHTIA